MSASGFFSGKTRTLSGETLEYALPIWRFAPVREESGGRIRTRAGTTILFAARSTVAPPLSYRETPTGVAMPRPSRPSLRNGTPDAGTPSCGRTVGTASCAEVIFPRSCIGKKKRITFFGSTAANAAEDPRTTAAINAFILFADIAFHRGEAAAQPLRYAVIQNSGVFKPLLL